MRSGFLSPRPGLRSKILLLTALTPSVLAAAVLLTVHHNVSSHVDSSSIHENLEHSTTVFESMLALRLRALATGAEVIARDPRFFSLVMLDASQRDAHFVPTLKGTATDFNRITQTDLFEVLDRRGRVLVSVGKQKSERSAREELVRAALEGETVTRVMAQGEQHYQIAVVPVRADRRTVGALMLGASIDRALALELKAQMRGEVTFVSNGRITGTTLDNGQDLGALKSWLRRDALAQGPLETRRVERVESGTQTYLTLLRPIPFSPRNTQFYVMQRSHEPESSFLKRMETDMFLLGGLAVLIALVAGWLFSRQITRPVLALVQGARAMENGDFDTEIAVSNRDEIGYLAERFRVMRERERAFVRSLQETARMKSEFISVASHELRTPISVIQGYRDLLADGSMGAMSPHQVQALNAIRDCLVQLTKVAEAATQVAQIESERLHLSPADTEITPIIQRAVAVAQVSAIDRRVRVLSDLEANLGMACIDASQIADTLAQLIGNGIRFTPDGGEVVVHGRGERDHVVIQVRDTGVGIPADRLGQLFGRTPPIRDANHHHSSSVLEFRSAGLGFGLHIARAIVEAHRGSIEVASEEGAGTTLTVRLPRAAPAAMRAAA
ncbi:MAG: ATP-binding protein [Candidatus Eisenbacteria bacterium]